jgi:hypothetical protein
VSENFIESVVNTVLKRQREEESIALSSLSFFTKRTRGFEIRDSFINVVGVFNSLSPVGDDPGVFLWEDEPTENQHADEFIDATDSSICVITSWKMLIVTGITWTSYPFTEGVTVYKKTEAPVHKQGIRLVIEVKKVSYHFKMKPFYA